MHRVGNQHDASFPVRLIGLNGAPPKTFKRLSTPDREAFVKNLSGA